jgi:hypothetical protein
MVSFRQMDSVHITLCDHENSEAAVSLLSAQLQEHDIATSGVFARGDARRRR